MHGLGINPGDGALFVATQAGLIRAPEGDDKPERVGDRFQDTMDFTIVGPDTFLGSGHPDGRDKLPPFLGLIRSDDGGTSWRPVSLLGKRDSASNRTTSKRRLAALDCIEDRRGVVVFGDPFGNDFLGWGADHGVPRRARGRGVDARAGARGRGAQRAGRRTPSSPGASAAA
jgi:hypothetical protein